MRKAKREGKAVPFLVGLALGYAVTIAVCTAAAAVLSLTDSAEKTAGAAAVVALSLGSFTCGKTAGIIRRRNGLKTGAVCGVLFVLPVAVVSVFFGQGGFGGFALKAILCIAFGMVGGVAGVNREERL